MIQITKAGLSPTYTTTKLEELRQEFELKHCILLKQFLHRELLQMMQRQLECRFLREDPSGT
jgi:hypothetical protein